jgi:hypothetical protein
MLRSCRVILILAVVSMVMNAHTTAIRASVIPKPTATPPVIQIYVSASAKPETSSAPTVIHFKTGRAIYVLATGGDQPTRGKLVGSMVIIMGPGTQAQPYDNLDLDNVEWLIPEPDWSEADFVQQCKNDQEHTAGAIVIKYIASATATANRLFERTFTTRLDATTVYAECAPPPSPSPSSSVQARAGAGATASSPPGAQVAYTWASSSVANGWGTAKQSTILPNLALAAAILGTGYATFVPSKTASTVSTHVFPTPLPLPASGATTTVATTSSSTTNASALGNLSTGVLAVQGVLSPASAPAIPNADYQTWDAAWDVATQLVDQMHCRARGEKKPLESLHAPFCAGP